MHFVLSRGSWQDNRARFCNASTVALPDWDTVESIVKKSEVDIKASPTGQERPLTEENFYHLGIRTRQYILLIENRGDKTSYFEQFT